MKTITLGIDPSLNNVGYCFYDLNPPHNHRTSKPPDLPQFLKMSFQTEILRGLLETQSINYVGIEQPYVAGSNRFGSGGHQSANMWAVYSMMLDVIKEHKLPVVMFNISQIHALIERKRGLTKTRVVELAKVDNQGWGRVDQHAADAYFVAKHAHAFWNLFDGRIQPLELSKDQQDVFLSTKKGNKGDPTGIIRRPGDFWYDFRNLNPIDPPGWTK